MNYLLPKTKQVLLEVSEFGWLQQFTFVGGSGLSLYLHHRLSEDIDLFTWEKQLDKPLILNTLNSKYNSYSIQQETDKQLDLIIDGVNVTFFANDWEALKKHTLLYKYLHVAQLDLLVAMKVNTLFLRAKFRDYYDLYALNLAGYRVADMYAIIEKNMPGMNRRLFQMAMVYTDDVEDDNISHLQPNYKVTKAAIAKHFQKEIDEWLFGN